MRLGSTSRHYLALGGPSGRARIVSCWPTSRPEPSVNITQFMESNGARISVSDQQGSDAVDHIWTSPDDS